MENKNDINDMVKEVNESGDKAITETNKLIFFDLLGLVTSLIPIIALILLRFCPDMNEILKNVWFGLGTLFAFITVIGGIRSVRNHHKIKKTIKETQGHINFLTCLFSDDEKE